MMKHKTLLIFLRLLSGVLYEGRIAVFDIVVDGLTNEDIFVLAQRHLSKIYQGS